MDRTERALASFLDDEEALVETWTVDTINRGFELSPPGMGPTETLGLTDRRLLWLDDDLETVEFADVKAIKTETMQSGTGSAMLRLGVLGLVVSVLATSLLWLFASLSTPLTIAPLGLGLLTFALSAITARRQKEDDGDVEAATHHYLVVRTPRTSVQIFAERELVEEIHDGVEAARD